MSRSSAIFYPSCNGNPASGAWNRPFWFMVALFVGLGIVAYATVAFDHAFGIATNSRALYVDEGFYSDSAQNFTKFGRWDFPFDFPHGAGAPVLVVIQSLAFPVFGATLETARLLSVAFGFITAFAFYSLLRMGLRPLTAVIVTITSILSFNYVVHARSALADPTAVGFAMLALLCFARLRIKELAISASVAFAFLAVLSKMYFVFTLATIVGLWLIELWLVPALTRSEIQKRCLAVLGLSLAAAGVLFGAFLHLFGQQLFDYYTINANNIPFLDPAYMAGSLIASIHSLPFNTKAHVYLLIIPASAVLGAAMLIPARQRAMVLGRAAALGRAELAVCLWLLAGLVTIGMLQLKRTHYHFFAILPLCFAGGVGLKLILPPRLHAAAISTAAVLHLLFQGPYYATWIQISDRMAIDDASRKIANIIHQRTEPGMVPVIGEYSAQLGLFSERVFSLDAKWSPSYPLCARVAHWTPRFHVNIVWPGSISQRELETLAECGEVERTEEIARFMVFEPPRDEMVLSRIYYKN